MKIHFRCLLSCLLAASEPAAFGQLDRCLEAHGGLQKWRSFAGLEYDLTWNSPQSERKDHQLFDLQKRSGLITGDTYTLGRDGGEVWIKPGLDALAGIPPRFYVGTPFYFFAMPFVFADPGTRRESLGKKTFRNQECEVIKITFARDAGDTPDDYYVAYIDLATARLKMAYYVVTYPAMRKDRPVSELEPHAIVFEEWQNCDGLLVPKTAPFYKWNGRDTEGEALGRLEYSNPHFLTQPPADAKFEKPADAVVAPM